MIRRAVLLALAAASPALAAADVENGKAVYAQCAACHSFDPAQALMGPHLKALIGRKAGSVEDYVYSPPMRRSSVVWTAETLDAFLVDPQAVVPGTKMPFAGLPTDKDRADLIAYLAAPAP
jgi:cytochrome c